MPSFTKEAIKYLAFVCYVKLEDEKLKKKKTNKL